MRRGNWITLWMCGCLLGVTPSSWQSSLEAAAILVDNFDGETARLNYSGFSNWLVQNGTIDTIKSGTFDITCHGGTGICLDLDGTTNNAGDLISKVLLEPGVYQVKFWLSGNQQPSGYGPDTLTVKLGSFSRSITVNNQDPFKQYIYEIELKQTKQRLVFSHAGGDTGGAILDNVEIHFLRALELPDPEPVPVGGPDSNIRRIGNKGSTFVIGDPIDTSSGELFFHEDPDLSLDDGPMPLRFARYYSSRMGDLGSGLGPNWSHSFLWRLVLEESSAYVVSPQGKLFDFEQEGAAWKALETTAAAFQLVPFERGQWAFADPREDHIYVFDANQSGRLLRIENGRGASLVLNYDSEGRLAAVDDGLGRSLGFEYQESGLLIAVTDSERRVGFTYTAEGELASAADFLGRVTDYAYDLQFPGEAKLSSLLRPAGNRPINQTYVLEEGPFRGWVASQTDGEGNLTKVSYEEAESGIIARIVDPLQFAGSHQYNAQGEAIAASDPRENLLAEEKSFAIDYTGRGMPSKLTDRLGAESGFEFEAESGLLNGVTHGDGSVTRFAYAQRTDRGLQFSDFTTITHADGSEDGFAYDSNGNLSQVTDAAGFVSQWSYNAQGQVVRAVNPLGGERTFRYDDKGRLVEETDEVGQSVGYEYDALGRQISKSFPDQSRVQFEYDQQNRLLSFTDENAATNRFVYDTNLNLVGLINPLEEQLEIGYDGNDRVSRITNPLGQTTSFAYDGLGRLASVTDPNTFRTTFTYDAWGRRTAVTDPFGNAWSYEYDAEGILSGVSDPLGNRTDYQSDAMGRTTQISSPLGHTTAFGYDLRGNLTSMLLPNGVGLVMDWDGAGNLVREALADGSLEVKFERDGFGNILRFTDSDGHDWLAEHNAVGHLSALTDPLGRKQVFEYDQRNRLLGINYANLGGRVDFAYDPAGQLIAETDSDGRSVTYTYDGAGRLMETAGIRRQYDAAGRLVESNGISASYDAGGRLESLLLSPGHEVRYAYDDAGNLVSVTDWMGAVTRFDSDALGRLIQIWRPNGVNRAQSFDADSELSHIEEEGRFSIRLTRDALGQIVSAARDGVLPPSLGGVPDRQVDFDRASQLSSGVYDGLGRMTSSAGDRYQWDLDSRLVEYERGGSVIASSYDARGYRVTKTSPEGVRHFVWNDILDLPSVSIEKRGDSIFRYYIHRPDGALLYAVDAESGARSFYHFDEIGNTRLITDDQGQERVAYHHTPYGLLTAQRGEWEQPFTWQGEYGVMDEGAGLFNVRSRYYDAELGAFLSPDPAREIGLMSQSPYQYAFGNPLSWIDIDGAAPEPPKGKNRRRPNAGPKVKKIGEFTAREAAAKLRAIQRQIREQEKESEKIRRRLRASAREVTRLIKQQQAFIDLARSAKISGLEKKDGGKGFIKRVRSYIERVSGERFRQDTLRYSERVVERKISILQSAEDQLKAQIKGVPSNLN